MRSDRPREADNLCTYVYVAAADLVSQFADDWISAAGKFVDRPAWPDVRKCWGNGRIAVTDGGKKFYYAASQHCQLAEGVDGGR
ncbi:unnamed protein product [Heligmosomoides polygyrus]|uniref:Transposase n=1 Tax=Heligmosomoides polygyrus TaxID=6339 RepID=A0A183GJ98_HELPZ|nr:unnamed protein product [Heligmosomoides polygyrus]